MSANKKGLAAFVKQQSEHALAGKILGLSAAKMRAGDFQHVKTEPAEDYRGRPAGVDIHYKLNGKDEVYGYANKKEAQHLERYSNRNIAESLGERNDPPMSGQNRPLPKGGKYTSAKTAADAAPSGRGTLAALGQKYRAAADRREQGKGAYDEGRSQATRYATEARKQGYTENEIDTHLQQHDKAAQRTVAAEGKIGESGSPTREPTERDLRKHEGKVVREAHPDERAELRQMAKDRQRDQPAVEMGAKGGRFVRLPGGGKRYVKE